VRYDLCYDPFENSKRKWSSLMGASDLRKEFERFGKLGCLDIRVL
jgi:hypothetical protein